MSVRRIIRLDLQWPEVLISLCQQTQEHAPIRIERTRTACVPVPGIPQMLLSRYEPVGRWVKMADMPVRKIQKEGHSLDERTCHKL